MQMIDELKHMYLYPATKGIYAPIDEKDRKKNSAILLLTPSLNSSIELTKLSYIYNQNAFKAFYVDRNVMAYINNMKEDDIEFDEAEEAAISEAYSSGWTKSVKFKFDDNCSMIDKKYVDKVYRADICKEFARITLANKLPDKINVVIHPTVSHLKKNAPKDIQARDYIYSYSDMDKNTIHVISKYVYDPEFMVAEYDHYLKTELIHFLIMISNPEIPYIMAKGIALHLSGADKWMRDNNSRVSEDLIERKIAYTTGKIIESKKLHEVQRYIKSGDMKIYGRYTVRSTIDFAKKLIFEADLSYFERQRLLPSDFGVPNKRKYPIHDEEHVRLAVKMFNHCDPDDEEELAAAIIKRMKKFGIDDIKVSASNRFKKYYKPEKKEVVKESVEVESGANGYDDVCQVCDTLSPKELSRITFSSRYEDSPYVLKRLVHKHTGADGRQLPVAFMDVYQYPSRPDIAQITIAVNPEFRNMGLAREMIKEVLTSDLHKENGINTYYWTAHEDNHTSQNLARRCGFKEMSKKDKYGRLVFILNTNQESIWNEIPAYMKPTPGSEDFVSTNESFVTESMAIFFEAEDESQYSQRLRKYLYSERLKNNKEVLEIYERVKNLNPDINRTYLKLKMYKKVNVFIDLSYYHSLFLRNNTYKMDKAINFYADFLTRLINNPEIDSEYSKKTVFIPVDANIWPVQPSSEVWDFKRNLNPISIFFRLIRLNPGALRKVFGNKEVVFVGKRGYFRIDMKKLDMKDLARLKVNVRKLMSSNEAIVDDFEIDSDVSRSDFRPRGSMPVDSSKAIAMGAIDRIEAETPIKINNTDAVKSISSKSDKVVNLTPSDAPHLRVRTDNLSINKDLASSNNGIAIISLDPNGPDDYKRLRQTVLSNADAITTYCMPN